MKKFLLASAASLVGLSTGVASAADLAPRPYVKAPPPIVAVYNWSGFYVGANGGYGWSDKCWDTGARTFGVVAVFVAPAGPEGCHDAKGGTVGGQIGYRWQNAAWVFGLEAQGNWADFKGSNASVYPLFAAVGLVNETKVNAFGLFTGQVGYAWNNTLLYVKGGAAVTSDKYRGYIAGVEIDNAKQTRWGGAVGVGLEYGFTPNWSFAIEYDHLFMGRSDVTFYSTAAPAIVSRNNSIHQDVDLITARINYKWGGPVIAKY